MSLPWRIGLMQSRLRHDQRPLRMAFTRRLDGLYDRFLLRVQRFHNRKHEMRLGFVNADVFRGIVAFFAKASCVEKTDDGRIRGEIEKRGRPRARLVALAHFRGGGFGQGPDNGRFAGLNFADEPDNRGSLARERRHFFIRRRDGLRRKNRIAKALPASRQDVLQIPPPVHDRHQTL